jgi:Flp pilus assembly protein TadD
MKRIFHLLAHFGPALLMVAASFQPAVFAQLPGTGEWDGVISPEAEEHHRLGLAAMKRADYKEAEREFRKALGYARKAVPVYNSLGEVNLATGELDRAITNFRIAIALGPTYAPAYANMGRALKRRKDFAGAREFYRGALRLQPDWPEVKALLAALPAAPSPLPPAQPSQPIAVPQPSTFPAACAQWKKAIEADDSNWSARFQCGRAMLAAGNATAALAELQRVADARPQDAVARYELARALLKLGRTAEARTAFTRALDLDPTLPPPPEK